MGRQGVAWPEHDTAQANRNDMEWNGLLWEWKEGMSGIKTVHGLAGWMDGYEQWDTRVLLQQSNRIVNALACGCYLWWSLAPSNVPMQCKVRVVIGPQGHPEQPPSSQSGRRKVLQLS